MSPAEICTMTGGAAGDGNQAVIRSAGNQRIDVRRDVNRRGRRLERPWRRQHGPACGCCCQRSGEEADHQRRLDHRKVRRRRHPERRGDPRAAAGDHDHRRRAPGRQRHRWDTWRCAMGRLSIGAGGVANTRDRSHAQGRQRPAVERRRPADAIRRTSARPPASRRTSASRPTRDVVLGSQSPTSIARIGTVLTTPPTNGNTGRHLASPPDVTSG